jgi:ubiquinone/menaquinone biosynthesis C-methylase UbiE
MGDEGRVLVIDTHESSVDILRKIIVQENICNILPLTADATRRLPLENSVVYVYLMVNALHGFVLNDEIHNVMQEIVRVTKRHGNLTIVDFKKTEAPAGPYVSEKLDPAEAEELLRKYGYVAETIDDIGPYSYLIRFIKR